ncbi:LCP family protein [Streptomyces olivoreticuli]|uniref:LCP family protein n=1 Tax=Streptomyces olivoreticuli TaxID=68246 RepID=UPI002657D0D3|nr:LCP family protein [Streptomyces olivoreticuli]WKK24543.1 LCP family protein [Streptomyces olivoreticuli]
MREEPGAKGRSSGGGRGEHAASGGRAARRRGGRRTPRTVIAGRAVAGLTSAAVLATSGVSWAAYHWITGGLNTSDALDKVRRNAPKHLDNSVNLLLIGLDSRKDMNGNDLPKEFVQDQLHAGSSDIGYYNTNTLILMHIPADGGKVQALSIPRDDYVQTYKGDGSPQGHYKIKEAYSYAYTAAHDKLYADGVRGNDLEAQSREAGREATLATVQNFLGVPIDHFAEVNLLGFYDIAKVLQPIQVCLKHPVHDRYSGADFPAGLQEVNPKQALAFVRQRHGLDGGDLDRTHRQQAFLSSVTHKLKSQGTFDSLGKLQGLFGVVKKDLVIDSKLNVIDFAQQATNLTGGKVEFNTLPTEGSAMRNGEDVELVDPEKIRAIVRKTMGGQDASATPSSDGKKSSAPAKPAPATVDVLNGSEKTGAAEDELKALAAMGYTAGQASNTAPQEPTTVVYGEGAQTAAQQIAAKLGATVAPSASSSVPAGHVQVTLGQAFTAPAAGPSPSPSGSSSSAPSGDFAGESVKEGGIPCVN